MGYNYNQLRDKENRARKNDYYEQKKQANQSDKNDSIYSVLLVASALILFFMF